MPLITVRKLDSNWDPVWGDGRDAYISDIDAVAQIIKQRLLFFRGEWWEDRTIGTPMFQSILGSSRSINAVASIIKNVILGSPYVSDVSNVSMQYESQSRSFKYSAKAQTPFGSLTISN